MRIGDAYGVCTRCGRRVLGCQAHGQPGRVQLYPHWTQAGERAPDGAYTPKGGPCATSASSVAVNEVTRG